MIMFKCPHCGELIELQVIENYKPQPITEKQTVEPADDIRTALTRMDDVELNGFAMQYFPRVFDKFSRGMQRDEKINLLLDYHRRQDNDYRQLKDALKSCGMMR